MDLFQISKPDYSKVDFSKLFAKYTDNRAVIIKYVQEITYPEYLPWEKARFKEPPAPFSREEAWFLAREVRTALTAKTPIQAPTGEYFTWARLNYTDQYLNKFDLYMGGQFMINQARISPSEQQSFLTRGVIEEAIASSQLEGASVTRKIARDMIAENRHPRNTSEWMIFNNYQMMSKLTSVYKDVPLSTELLLDMHKILAADTMDKEDIGRFRTDKDPISVGNDIGTVTTYIPPKKKFLDKGLDDLIAFANDTDPENFVHPIIKAIMLHFWIGFLHPFCDGNGRIARALFYWLLLKNNYWLATYIPISTVIKRAPVRYSDAYVYSEQDNFDFTYFFDYHMKRIMTALDDFLHYVEKQREENTEIDKVLEAKGRLNERQKQIMHFLLADQHHKVSVTSHSALNGIAVNTARSDLEELRKLQLIFPLRSGKFVHYYAKPLK